MTQGIVKWHLLAVNSVPLFSLTFDRMTGFMKFECVFFIVSLKAWAVQGFSKLQEQSISMKYSLILRVKPPKTNVVFLDAIIHPFDNYVPHTFWSWNLALISKLRKVIGSRERGSQAK